MDEFDGDAISRADREFLASLGEHPFKRDPRYGTPCPPRPNFGPFNATDPVQTAARLKHFEDVVTWMLANYAYREGAFISIRFRIKSTGGVSAVDSASQECYAQVGKSRFGILQDDGSILL